MRDLIDERNKREKLMRSVVKRANVNYITKEELERQKEQEKIRAMEGEKSREEAKETALELERKRAQKEQELLEQALYEASLPPSSKYGMVQTEDEVTKEQIDAILAEKQNAYEQMLKEVQKEDE